ncbi:MAG: hypothetical protein AB7I37_26235 [Pirellulales bacterium]
MGILTQLMASVPPPTKPTPPPDVAQPEPCLTCGSPGFWVDAYDGLHCRGCDPPTVPTLVSRKVWVVGTPGRYEWATNFEWQEGRDAQRRGPKRFEIERDEGVIVVHVAPSRIDYARLPAASGRYNPSLGAGPVGDLTIAEWFDLLPRE